MKRILCTPTWVVKGTSHILQTQAWDRDGGEDIATAVTVPSLPVTMTTTASP